MSEIAPRREGPRPAGARTMCTLAKPADLAEQQRRGEEPAGRGRHQRRPGGGAPPQHQRGGQETTVMLVSTDGRLKRSRRPAVTCA